MNVGDAGNGAGGGLRRIARPLVLAAAAAMAALALWFAIAGNPLAPGPGGPFRLVDQDGRTVTDRDFLGAPYGIYFGYTHCPDVCPTTLSDYLLWRQDLGAEMAAFRLAFVTVDPERDTPAILKSYLASFSDTVIGLTGDEAAIAAAVAAFGVYRAKVPGTDGDYTMDHTATIFLFDRHGRYFGKILYQQPLEKSEATLKALLSAP